MPYQTSIDQLYAKLALIHGLLTEEELSDYLRVQEKMVSLGIKKFLPDVIPYVQVLPEDKEKALKEFFANTEVIVNGLLITEQGIRLGKLTHEDIKELKASQNAIFTLKKIVLPLQEIIKKNKRLSDDELRELSEAVKNQGESEYVLSLERILQSIISETEQQKIVKPSDEKENTETLAEKSEAPPSRLEIMAATDKSQMSKTSQRVLVAKQETSAGGTSEKQKTGQRPLVSKDIHEKHSDITSQKISPHLPPSKLTYPLEGKTAEHKQIKKNRGVFAPFMFTITALAILGGFIYGIHYIQESEERQYFSSITYQFENKEHLKAENLCQRFIREYPKSSRLKEVKEIYQNIISKRADIAIRQNDKEKAIEYLNYMINIFPEGKLSDTAMAEIDKLQKEIKDKERLNEFQRLIQESSSFIQKGDLEEADKRIASCHQIASTPDEIQQLKEFSQKLQELRLSRLLKTYRLVPWSSKEPSIPQRAPLPKGISLKKMLLLPSYLQGKSTIKTKNFFVILKGFCYGLSILDGKVQWIEWLGEGRVFPPLLMAGGREYHDLSLVDQVLLVSPASNTVKLLKAETGEVIWQRCMPGIISAGPVIYRNEIYVGCLDNHCYLLNPANGEIKSYYIAGGPVLQAPTFDSRLSLMYLACGDGFIYVFDIKAGIFALRMTYQDDLTVPPVALYPYIGVVTLKEDKTNLVFYPINRTGDTVMCNSQAPVTLQVPGRCLAPASVSRGVMALGTEGYVALLGVNPVNPKEAIFSLTGDQGYRFTSTHGPAFLRFEASSELGASHDRLIIAADNVVIYQIKEFEEKNTDILTEEWNYRKAPKTPQIKGYSYMPIQRAKDIILFATRNPDEDGVMVLALNIKEHSILWQRRLGLSITSEPLLTNDGRILMRTSFGDIHEIYPDPSGKNPPIYRTFLNSQGFSTIPSPPILVSQDAVFVAGYDRCPRLLDAVTGWEIPEWKVPWAFKGALGSAVYGDGVIFLGSEEGAVFAISAKTGEKAYLEFEVFKGKPFFAPPLYIEKSVVIGSDDGCLYRLGLIESHDGNYIKETWRFQTKGPLRTRPALYKGIIWFGSDDGHIYGVSLEKGTLYAKITVGSHIRCDASIHKNTGVLGTEDGSICAWNTENGKLLWSKTLGGSIRGRPLINEGKVYVASISGKVGAFELDTGKQLWELHLDGGVEVPMIQTGDKIYAPGLNGMVYIIEKERE